MAFVLENFSRISSSANSKSVTYFAYVVPDGDTIADLVQVGYFDELKGRINLGDAMFVRGGTVGTPEAYWLAVTQLAPQVKAEVLQIGSGTASVNQESQVIPLDGKGPSFTEALPGVSASSVVVGTMQTGGTVTLTGLTAQAGGVDVVLSAAGTATDFLNLVVIGA